MVLFEKYQIHLRKVTPQLLIKRRDRTFDDGTVKKVLRLFDAVVIARKKVAIVSSINRTRARVSWQATSPLSAPISRFRITFQRLRETS